MTALPSRIDRPFGVPLDRPSKVCENCGKVFELPPNPTQSDRRLKNCSKECAASRRATGISKSYTSESMVRRRLRHEDAQNELKSGKKYGRLTAIKRDHVKQFPSGSYRAIWLFQCDCGGFVKRSIFDVSRKDGSASKSCGCHKKGRPAATRLEHGLSSFRNLFYAYKARATKRKVPFTLTEGQFRNLTTGDCYYCGKPPGQIRMGHALSFGSYIYNGIDRMIGELGYVLDNCVPACGVCNKAKNIMTEKEFLLWIEKVFNLRVRQNTETSKWKRTA